MLKDVKKFYDLGYALHLLKPNSKQPLESRWSKGERKTWKELKVSYQYGNNIGVRLGAASKLSDGSYLSAIDCDVKSSNPKHEKEMLLKLSELIDVKAPEVFSGRGNGSRHLHIRTKEVISPFRFSQSPEKVKVHMPSIEPSRKDKELLSKDELLEGYRMRAAWEISVMSEGQQVVLPPSTHPDTQEPYVWGRGINQLKDIPLVDFSHIKAAIQKKQEHEGLKDFTPVEVDLISSELPDSIVDLIISGKNCEDRSASLYGVTIAMSKAGFSENEILSVLTDRENFLGQTAYDHAQTKSRKRAAQWVKNYTFKKVQKETSAENDFDTEINTVELSDEDAEAQKKELVRERTWQEKLDRTSIESGARLKPTFKNLHLVLENQIAPDLFRYDEFANSDIYGASAPWFGARIGKAVTDNDALQIKAWFANKYNLEYAVERIHEAISYISHKNKFHPVRDYLESLEWDGVERMDTWIEDYLSAKQQGIFYLQEVSRLFLLGMVARIMQPGIKFDHMIILEGDQGVGKSSALRYLAEPWFSDAPFNLGDKDAVVGLQSVWLLEVGELSGLTKADVNAMKAFISQQTDKIRVPYGRRSESFPRQCIFAGTTNESVYLKDTTGNRRFWPIEVGQCKFKKLIRDRDQLFAEAFWFYSNFGVELRLSKEAQAEAKEFQADKVPENPYMEKISKLVSKSSENFNVKSFTMDELLDALNMGGRSVDNGWTARLFGQCLSELGYTKQRLRKNGARLVVWKR